MKTTMLTFALGSAIAAVGVAVAVHQAYEARAASAELAAAKEKRDTLARRIAETEAKIALTDRRAAETENDTGELLKAVESVRRQRAAEAARADVARDAAQQQRAVLSTEARQLLIPQPSLSSRMGSAMTTLNGRTVMPGGVSSEPNEQQRLAVERVYQQDLAKTRTATAKRKAEFYESVQGLDRSECFNRGIEEAQRFAARGEFQEGIQVFNYAIAMKPADAPLPESVRDLQATLRAQNAPVDVTLNSDGETFVWIRNAKGPMRFQTVTLKVLPGDYEVIGRRAGFLDVVVPLRVRNGEPPPAVTVVCTAPAAK